MAGSKDPPENEDKVPRDTEAVDAADCEEEEEEEVDDVDDPLWTGDDEDEQLISLIATVDTSRDEERPIKHPKKIKTRACFSCSCLLSATLFLIAGIAIAFFAYTQYTGSSPMSLLEGKNNLVPHLADKKQTSDKRRKSDFANQPHQNPDLDEQNRPNAFENKQVLVPTLAEGNPNKDESSTGSVPAPTKGYPNKKESSEPENKTVVPAPQLIPQEYPHFECPDMFDLDPDSDEVEHYLLSTDRVKKIDKFLEKYRESTFDHCESTYEELKNDLYDWKARRFGSNLKDGDSIYESASGLGLNLVLTLEILNEVNPDLNNLVVYGNDLVPESVLASNQLMDKGILPFNGKKGLVCQGDSSKLNWVPSNAFDLVFTGFLAPLQDPLGFDLNENALWAKYAKICKQNTDNQVAKVQQMAKLQGEWFHKWVSEMIRIAKPGAPVIIEQVTPSVCSFWDDWGGVDREWWYAAAEEYEWDVDRNAIEIEADRHVPDRYHVFMRKNKE